MESEIQKQEWHSRAPFRCSKLDHLHRLWPEQFVEKKELANVADITDVTLRIRLKDLERHLDLLNKMKRR
jgi:hypothetical protein